MTKKTLKELHEKAERERKKTKTLEIRRGIKSEISESKRTRRQLKYGKALKGAREVGRTTVGLAAAGTTLVGKAIRQSQEQPTRKKSKKKKTSQPKRKNVFEDIYRGGF